jgi:hypothetical protein
MRILAVLASLLAVAPARGDVGSAEPGTRASVAGAPTWRPDERDPRQRLLAALVDELERARRGLKLKANEPPYFVGYALRAIGSQEPCAAGAQRRRALVARLRAVELPATCP